jgi:acyl-CoA reductase-like NAD-dependent aldehyde dehydrogenase
MSSLLGKVFLDGEMAESASPAALTVVNPSTGKAIGSIPGGCDEDVNKAVSSARKAFEDGRWSESPPSMRRRALSRLADLIEVERAQLDLLDAVEMGKPISESLFNAGEAAGLVRFYAEAVDKVCGEVYTSDKTSFVAQRRVPRGVVAAIVPWNFPTFNAILKVAPALAAGNCVVLKPSELASRSALRLAQLAIDAGVPSGVFNVVVGQGEIAGRALGLHRDVDMVAFTGSSSVGGLMLEYAGRSNLKAVLAECGGKSPQILFDDGVDVDAACDSIAGFLLANQGQICSVGSRLLVQRSIESRVTERITQRLRRIVVGDASNAETTFGPLASKTQCSRVIEYIENGPREGAQLVFGGRRILKETGGYFVEPTVFRQVPRGSRLAQEEIFGPVLSVMTFEDEREAIQLANDTVYGLSANVWTNNLSTAMRLTKGVKSSLFINAAVPQGEGAGNACSFEPTGHSGFGVEGGLAGMESFMRRRLMWVNHA